MTCACGNCDLRTAIDADDIEWQKEWSELTFGPGARTGGVTAHIRKELAEIEADPTDLSEWIDVLILAIDGAWRAGYPPELIIEAYHHKMSVNYERQWPDWRESTQDQPIEHVRGEIITVVPK